MHKHARWHELCQTHKEYFALWEAGRGPGQSISQDQPAVPRPKDHRVGRELFRILGCHNGFTHVTELNDWGPDGCEEHIEQIVVWIHEAAGKRAASMCDEAARRLIVVAIQKSRQALAKASECRRESDTQ